MSFVLFDKVRLLFKRANIFSHENILQNQPDAAKVYTNPNGIIDINDPAFFIEQSNVQINRLERMKDYDQMDEMGEMSLALDLYGDESSLVDPERKHTLIIKSKTKIIKEELTNVVCGYHLAVIRTYQGSYSKYLFQALKTKLFNAQFEICSNGITRVGLGNSDLKNGYFLLPPEDEQIKISNFIEAGTSKIATAISLKEQEIEKLKEYKATLINSAVTGKIKVS